MLLTVFLSMAVGFCGAKLWDMSAQYLREEQVKDSMQTYIEEAAARPGHEEPAAPQTGTAANPFIYDLQNDINDDIVAWINIPGTKIDYPIVKAEDNDFYLRRDVYKEQSQAGSIFMDCRHGADFSDFNTVVYGHYMRNGSMFGGLHSFADPDFFEANPRGSLLTGEETYTLEIFAYLVVRADDSLIYGNSASRDEYFDYVKSSARNYREPANPGKVVTLSTCAYEFEGARSVVIAVMAPEAVPGRGD